MLYRISLIILSIIFISCSEIDTSVEKKQKNPLKTNAKQHDFALVIHGGAGYLSPKNDADKEHNALKTTMDSLLIMGKTMLEKGGEAIDVVTKVITIMEDDPRFNAGKGAVFANNGKNELDASIMHGKDLNAGAVAGVTNIKHPILAAKEVMTSSRHVFMAGQGAEQFAEEQGLTLVDNKYFFTQNKFERLEKAKKQSSKSSMRSDYLPDEKYGTVGCVALDKKGNIVAGTSTGGLTNKQYNRIGDSPVIGAGTYADNRTCGVSCTGVGEFFIRYAVAHEMSSQYRYTDKTIQEIGDDIINKTLKDINADGGLIALDKYGNVAMPFNTTAMLRGYINEEEKVVALFH